MTEGPRRECALCTRGGADARERAGAGRAVDRGQAFREQARPRLGAADPDRGVAHPALLRRRPHLRCVWSFPGLVSGARMENANLLWEGGPENSEHIVAAGGRAGDDFLMDATPVPSTGISHRNAEGPPWRAWPRATPPPAKVGKLGTGL